MTASDHTFASYRKLLDTGGILGESIENSDFHMAIREFLNF